jgi:asparagine synthase (glutamine-hydrolysing)
MCGILAILGASDPKEARKRAVELAPLLRHRGPDWSGMHVQGNNIFAHERLAIVDVQNGAQPLFNEDKTYVLVVNGEIYNHKDLERTLQRPHRFATQSDCECIVHLYEERGETFLDEIQGDFAFVVSGTNGFLAARDPIGVCPLYMGWGRDGSLWFASEMKALIADCPKIESFPPGFYYTKEKGLQPYYKPLYHNLDYIPTQKPDFEKIRRTLEIAVIRRLMTDTPYGALLSGGLDSSIVAAIANRYAARRVEENFAVPAWWPRLHTFCIGLTKDSPDMVKAREVANYLGTVHHEFCFSVQDGLDAIKKVIWHIESYDVTTVRASTPMYLLARCVKAVGVKMVLSGEGSDEIFGGYLYFHQAPDAESFHRECVRRVRNLHLSDCLRANKATAAWGVEIRVPFLDKDFLDVAMNIDPREKMCSKGRIEKWILRKAFDTPENPYLPQSILWRQKEQFSDGVGYSWIDSLKKYAESEVSDDEFAKRHELFPLNTPTTKEAFFYRKIFHELFPNPSAAATVQLWVPTWSVNKDPSGRAQVVHQSTTEKN